jgi:hypothetical protein
MIFAVLTSVAAAACPSPGSLLGPLVARAQQQSVELPKGGVLYTLPHANCSLGDREVAPREAGGGRLDGFLEIRPRGSEPIRVDVLPVSEVYYPDAGDPETRPFVACDTEARRIFYANVVLGYVVALDQDGQELWRATLPEFTPVPAGTRFTGDNVQAYTAAVLRGSAVSGIALSGPFVAVRYRTGLEIRAAVFHRAGFLIGTIGPDNVLLEAAAGGFRFGSNRTESGGVSCIYTVTVTDDRDALLEHALATLQPPLGATQYSLGCLGETGTLREVLGQRFRGDLATEAAAMRAELSRTALNSFLSDPGVFPLMQEMKQSPQWRASFRRALLQAGADVAFVPVMRPR